MTCIASGGTVVSSSLTGPGGVDLELQPVGSIGRTGQNIYSVTSGTVSGRNDGDTYQCTAVADLSSPHLSDSIYSAQRYTSIHNDLYITIMYICIYNIIHYSCIYTVAKAWFYG